MSNIDFDAFERAMERKIERERSEEDELSAREQAQEDAE